MSSSSVDKIKEILSIVDVVSTYLTVEKAGKNYKAKCPFHNEKTPSFFISPDRGSYYCFGCGAKGDIFSFVEHFEGTDFLGSLKILANRAGVELSTYQSKDKGKTDIYYEIMESATDFFEKSFEKNKEARSYLLGRGISDISISSFRIGFAPDSWTMLLDYLIKKGYKLIDIETVGLIKKGNSGKFYDRFRSRIMFPIMDSSGRVIAFSGRIFPENNKEVPIEIGKPTVVDSKYLNSPDTPLFNKSNVLFGIDKAKIAVRSRNYSIIVEGQMDLIMSHQAGFANTVAVSGTAFSDSLKDHESKINNLGLIKRLSSNIIFAFDGDDAGIRAVSRSAMIALSLEMQVKIAVLPKGEDPAEVILKDENKWKDIIKNSVNIISFHLDRICKNTDDLRLRGKQVREIIFPFLIMISSSIERSAYINEIHGKTGLRESAIIEDFDKYEKAHFIESKKEEIVQVEKDTNSRRSNLEKRFASIVFWQEGKEDNKREIGELISLFESDIGKEVLESVLDTYKPFSENLILEIEMLYENKKDAIIKDL